jgi:prevent-host-death family protein
MTWQVYDAKARFSEFLDATLKEGPQIITKRGVEAAQGLSATEYQGDSARSKWPARPLYSTSPETSLFPAG